MGNQTRLNAGELEQVKGYILDVLTEQGMVTHDQRLRIGELINRSMRTVERYIAEVVETMVPAELPPAADETYGSALEALVDRGQFSFSDDEIKKLCLAYAGNLAALHRDATKLAEKLDLAGPVSHVHLTRKFNAELDSDERGLIRHGIEGFKNASLYVRWSAQHRNEVWQIDATQMDFWMQPKGAARIRPWGLFVIDDCSRVILSASLMTHDYTAADSAACVYRAMRMREITLPDGRVVDVGGLPEKILCDNALQFTGEVLSTVALTLGFTMWAVAVYMGEKKGKVERVIRAANEDWARKLPGYANRNLKTLTARDALHASDEQLLNEQQALDELGKWVEEWNHSPHPQVKGKSRYEVWADDTYGIQEVEERLLQPAAIPLPRSSYTYSKSGFRVQRDGDKYFYIHQDLAGRVQEKFGLRHLPGDLEWVDAYDLDGKFVARCFDADLVPEEARAIEQRRRETYSTLRSLRSEAVELRSLAASEAIDTADRPNPIATAHQRETTPAAIDLVQASLGLPSAHPGAGALPAGDASEVSEPADTHPSATPVRRKPVARPSSPKADFNQLVTDAFSELLSDEGDA